MKTGCYAPAQVPGALTSELPGPATMPQAPTLVSRLRPLMPRLSPTEESDQTERSLSPSHPFLLVPPLPSLETKGMEKELLSSKRGFDNPAPPIGGQRKVGLTLQKGFEETLLREARWQRQARLEGG